MNRHKLSLAAAISCALSLYFMGESQQQPPVVADAQSTVVNTAAKSDKAQKSESNPQVEKLDEEQPAEEQKMEVAFQPPFADRTDLFRAPKRQGGGRQNSANQSESAVELLGFVNVDGQRVVLSIDGLASLVAEGSTQSGIEVVKIRKPTVVLKRAQQRSGSWVLSTDF